jgi:hypothetical protein
MGLVHVAYSHGAFHHGSEIAAALAADANETNADKLTQVFAGVRPGAV